ncbi:hypothetical protein G4O51_11950 [Candidatus Bathyarchaeota archaeon A05DMB-2]|nr:hypothetical protein [Candidatus Bathyarchaeota archaeon A05DMB-2]
MAKGKCPRCGRWIHAQVETTVECDCWMYCPLCGGLMEPYQPDTSPEVYGVDGKRDLLILRVCYNVGKHAANLPFYSTQKPVEVELT